MGAFLQQVAIVSWWTLLSTPVFFLAFVGLVWWVMRREQREKYIRASNMPLEHEGEGASTRYR